MQKLSEKINAMTESQILSFVQKEKSETIHALKLYLDDLYYNTGSPAIDDVKYDVFKEEIEKKYPDYIPPVGAKIRTNENRVKLPVWMGSLDKIVYREPTQSRVWADKIYRKTKREFLVYYGDDGYMEAKLDPELGGEELDGSPFDYDRPHFDDIGDHDDIVIGPLPDPAKELNKWMSTNCAVCGDQDYVVASKLDGVSCLAVCEKGKGKIKLYTRGDGDFGSDVSFLAQYIDNLPKVHKHDVVVRGELLISVKEFQEKYGGEYKNSRNMVSGLVGAKTVREGLKSLRFVAYEIVSEGESKTFVEQFGILRNSGFEVVRNVGRQSITIDSLITELASFKEKEKYEIDGLVVMLNDVYERNTEGNPGYMFAFKTNSESNMATTRVNRVEWRISQWKKIIPRIHFDPVELSGATIFKATAFNAKYVVDHRIGKGAMVKLVRSGDVIPHIVGVIEPSTSGKPDLPDIEYDWDETKVHIFARDAGAEDQVKLTASFFAKLRIDHVALKTVEKLYKAGFNTTLKIIGASKEKLVEAGFGDRSAERIVENIHTGLQGVKIATVIGASGCLGNGIGRRKSEALFKALPDILDIHTSLPKKELRERLMSIEGFSDKSVDGILPRLEEASEFINELEGYATFAEEKASSSTLENLSFVLSGFRDEALTRWIENQGGNVRTSVSSLTSGVIVKAKGGKETGKVADAKKVGAPIYTLEEFRRKFKIDI